MPGIVNVTSKKEVLRIAEAKGRIYLRSDTITAIKSKKVKKGDPIATAEISGIIAVKKTWEHIPHCHQIPITGIDFDFKVYENFIECTCRVEATYKTGVEMEALCGVAHALLTLWDMVKALEKDEHGNYPETKISDIVVVSKVKVDKDGQ